MNIFLNIYLVCAILGLLLYPGFWNRDFAAYANNRVKGRNKKYTSRNFYIGGMFFAMVPLLNVLFAVVALSELFVYRKWKRTNNGIQ